MAKERIEIPKELAAVVQVASDHTCCKCEERGAPIQIHHIDEDPANNNIDNLAVLCLRCHHDTQITGGFSRKLSAEDIRQYRDQWVARVQKRRRDADSLFVARATGLKSGDISTKNDDQRRSEATSEHIQIDREEALAYIEKLPDILEAAYVQARSGWSSNTIEINRATYGVSEVLQEMWLYLSRFFPQNHFGSKGEKFFLEEYVKTRYQWHHALYEPYGPGKSGTVAGVLTSRAVMRDLQDMVVNTVNAIRGLGDKADAWRAWLRRWKAAQTDGAESGVTSNDGTVHAEKVAIYLEEFAIECACMISSAEWEYTDGGQYAHLKIPQIKNPLTIDDEKYLDKTLLGRANMLPNENLLAQKMIDGMWSAEPGEQALKDSFNHVAACGMRAWDIASDLRTRYLLPKFDASKSSFDFFSLLHRFYGEED